MFETKSIKVLKQYWFWIAVWEEKKKTINSSRTLYKVMIQIIIFQLSIEGSKLLVNNLQQYSLTHWALSIVVKSMV